MATLDIDTLRLGHEKRDPDILASLYAEGAQLKIVDNTRPPSSPMLLSGKAQIAEFWRDICSRDMTHEVQDEVLGDGRAAFCVACQYADGTRVLAAQICDVNGQGQITRETVVQAWDT